MKEVKERIAALRAERAKVLARGESIKNVEEMLVDEVTYLRSLERKDTAKAETKKGRKK